jgi:UDP-N-acetyl-D-mannosaminuronate dehydrogenase
LLKGEGNLEQSETAVSINDRMPRYAFEFLERRYAKPLAGVKVLLLGASYRGDVGDTRFSPVEPFYRCLKEAGAGVSVQDPFVRHWPEMVIDPLADLPAALAANPNIVVISTGHSQYKEERTIEKLLACEPFWIYDTIGLLSPAQIKQVQEKHKVIVLGRGDL